MGAQKRGGLMTRLNSIRWLLGGAPSRKTKVAGMPTPQGVDLLIDLHRADVD